MAISSPSATSLADAPTHTDIEAARRAWLATCHALGGHLDDCSACQVYEDCEAYAVFDATERAAWTEYEATKGGHHGSI